RTWSGYIQDEWSIGQDWTVNYGLRGDTYSLAGHTESQLSPRLGVVWQATGSTTVHAGYSRYFTPPATEMITTSNIAKFAGTTNAVSNPGNATPLAERANYFDVGVSQNIGDAWTLGLDTYYRQVQRLQDEGQFGAALVYSTFNYDRGHIGGVEFTANYSDGPLSAYFNLAYIADNYIHLDHDQTYTSSGGISYALADSTRVGADYLFGSGLRKDGAVPNGAHLPAYFQLNLNVSHDFTFDHFGKLHTQLALINALDRTYELRDGTG